MAEKSAYKSLQNGSDIRGIAVDPETYELQSAPIPVFRHKT